MSNASNRSSLLSRSVILVVLVMERSRLRKSGPTSELLLGSILKRQDAPAKPQCTKAIKCTGAPAAPRMIVGPTVSIPPFAGAVSRLATFARQ